LLVEGREQGKIGGYLQDRAVVPGSTLVALAQVTAAPGWQVGLGVLCGTASGTRFCQQGFIVFLRRGEAVGADDFFARVVAVAETPRGAARRIVADQWYLVGTPDLLQTHC